MGCMDMEAWVNDFNGYVKEWRIACTHETPCKRGSGMENEWEEDWCDDLEREVDRWMMGMVDKKKKRTWGWDDDTLAWEFQLGPEGLAVGLREANKEPEPESLISLTQCLLQEYYTSRMIQHNNSPHGPPHHQMPGSAPTQTFPRLWSLEYALREEKKTRR